MFNHFAILSLVLFIATAACWIRSYWFIDFIGRYDGHGGGVGVTSCKGSLSASVNRVGYGTINSGFYWDRDWAYRWGTPEDILAFEAGRVFDSWYLVFPHWVLCIVFGALPTLFVARHWRRRNRGDCPKCGFDLRATPDRCPECGWNRSTLTPDV